MKKAILTIGLFSLIMILTSFTTPETVSTTNNIVYNGSLEIAGTQSASGAKKLDIAGTQSASGAKKLDIAGTQSASGAKKLDIAGTQSASGAKKLD